MGEFITEHELNGKKEITFSRAIPADDDIVAFIERFDNGLLAVAFETLNDNLRKEEQFNLAAY